jgi:hypothetical protein
MGLEALQISTYLETPKPRKIKGSVIKPGFALQNQGLQFMHVSTPLADAFFPDGAQ